ncbi:hypothetical protein MMC30_004612 [Trapelia coarctata]|nr:hypothetical protein [Trapelia coarctata]
MVLPGSYTGHLDEKRTVMAPTYVQNAYRALFTSTKHFSPEHEVFVAFWKHRIPDDQIMARVIQSFPNIVTFIPYLHDREAHYFATVLVVRQWLKYAISDEAPIQRPTTEQILSYKWGPATIGLDFLLWRQRKTWESQVHDVPLCRV